MAKRALCFASPKAKHQRSEPDDCKKQNLPTQALSEIDDPQSYTTIIGVISSLSPVKPKRYFDGKQCLQLIGFDKSQQTKLDSFDKIKAFQYLFATVKSK